MDIWRWVHSRQEALIEDGHKELSNYIDQIPTHAVNADFDKVDQVYHAALPLCRAIEDEWLEVFFRHWRLQAHVLNNYDAKGLLPEAISLLDFTHSDTTKDCPQRICAVQDLAACYGIKDGPGFAEERISVCKETLSQIDGSWPCYQCVGGELLDAYIDSEKPEMAKEEDAEIKAELSKFNHDDDGNLKLVRTELLIKIGELDAAWNLIAEAESPESGDSFVRKQTLLKTLILCLLNKWDEAQSIAPPFEEALRAAKHFSDWTRIQSLFVEKGLIQNNRDLRYKFHLLAHKLEARDALRGAFGIYERLIDLCMASNEPLRANIALEHMRILSPRFNRDMGAKDKIETLAQKIIAIEAPKDLPAFETIDTLLKHEFRNETQEARAVETALKTWAGDTRLIVKQSTLLEDCFKRDAAFDLLSKTYQEHKGSSELESHYGKAFLAKFGFDDYKTHFPMDQLEGLSKGAIWNRGFNYVTQHEDKAPQKALGYLKIIETYWPEDVWLMGRIANLHLKLKNFDELMTYRRKQVEGDPDNANHKWDVLIAATLKNDVPVICEMARALEIELTDAGEYAKDNQATMRLQWNMPNGTIANYYAQRIGPARARLTSISNHSHGEQIYGREVVFDPAPLNKLDQEDDEGYSCDKDGFYNLLYPAPLHTLIGSEYKTYPVDGVHPGEKNLQVLFDRINDAEFVYQQRSGETYRLYWKDGKKDHDELALYLYILIKEEQKEKLNDLLKAFSDTLKYPLIWTELAEDLKDDILLEAQVKTKEKYNIE